MTTAWLRVAAMLVLVLATRQSIYRLYLHPVGSWLPFLLALMVYLLLFRPSRHDFRLLGIFYFSVSKAKQQRRFERRLRAWLG